jgi:hypothetical protein
MHNVYFYCALVGGTLLLIQIVLQIIGLGGEGDLDHAGGDSDFHVDGAEPDIHGDAHVGDPAHGTAGNLFFGILSFKALVSFTAIFGLTGLSLEDSGLSQLHETTIALLAGLVAMVAVAWMMRTLYRLGSSGTVVLDNALGHTATVYLRVPANGEGRGKVTVEIQKRSVELTAVTDGEEIATGRIVTIVEVLPNETVKVTPV